jgi:hypothetical protein
MGPPGASLEDAALEAGLPYTTGPEILMPRSAWAPRSSEPLKCSNASPRLTTRRWAPAKTSSMHI